MPLRRLASSESCAAWNDADLKPGMPVSRRCQAQLSHDQRTRGEHVLGAFDVTHYRPKERPDEVRVIHPKNKKAVWVPLFDDAGEPLYPELMVRLDAIKATRIGGLTIVRDWKDDAAKIPLPWMTGVDDWKRGYQLRAARNETADR